MPRHIVGEAILVEALNLDLVQIRGRDVSLPEGRRGKHLEHWGNDLEPIDVCGIEF
jgi:hypothetical protein